MQTSNHRPTDELVHWTSADMYSTGDDHFQLEFQTIIDADAVNWLNNHLADRLAAWLDSDGIGVDVRPAQRTTGGYAQFGVIAISGLSEPFPPADEMRQFISDAVADAHDEADTANAAARAYVTALRDVS